MSWPLLWGEPVSAHMLNVGVDLSLEIAYESVAGHSFRRFRGVPITLRGVSLATGGRHHRDLRLRPDGDLAL